MKYVLYLRVSDKELQDLRTQEEKCLQFIKSKESKPFNYMLFTDRISGTRSWEKREGLQNALKALEGSDILVCLRVDRLSRNLHETTCIIKALEDKGADILMVDQPGIKNKVLLGLYAGIAEEEVYMIRKRIKEKMDVKRSRFERVSRHIPYGYEMHPTELVSVNGPDRSQVLKLGKLVERADEQAVLSLMGRWHKTGMTYRDIAQELRRLGYMNRVGRPFHYTYIHRILSRTGQTRSVGQALKAQPALQSHG